MKTLTYKALLANIEARALAALINSTFAEVQLLRRYALATGQEGQRMAYEDALDSFMYAWSFTDATVTPHEYAEAWDSFLVTLPQRLQLKVLARVKSTVARTLDETRSSFLRLAPSRSDRFQSYAVALEAIYAPDRELVAA